LYTTRQNIKNQIGKYSLSLKHLLANLSDANAPIQAQSLSLEHYYRYSVLSVIRSSQDTVSSLISPDKNASLLEKSARFFEDDFKQIALVTTAAEKGCLMSVRSIKGLQRALLTYYVEMILRLDTFLAHVRLILDELEECLIKNDVLMMKKYQDEMTRKQRILDAQFDLSVVCATRRIPDTKTALQLIEDETVEFEKLLADRVYQLNKSYVNGMQEQQAFLNYLDKQLARQDKRIVVAKETNLELAKKNATLQKHVLDLEHRRYIAGYESQKKKNYVACENANSLAGTRLTTQQKLRTESLSLLHQTIGAVPKKNEQYLLDLELEKEKYTKELKANLLHELAHIEEQKFISRPAYLTQMAAIRERLPEDYLSLYKQIASAQGSFVKEFQATNDLYAREYDRFLNNQVEYNSILFNDSIIFHPFEKYLFVADRIKMKTDEAFIDTQNKSSSTLDEIKKQANDSEENQKRIINA
jgi:hypothetical protein